MYEREGDPLAGSMNKYLAELLGTFVLVGIGSLAILSSDGSIVAIAFGFGLALMAGIYMFGGLTGAHFNPAVTLAMFLRKDMDSSDLIGYWIAQVAGAVLASSLVAYAATADLVGERTVTRSSAGLEAVEVLIIEAILTAIFVMVILRTTSGDGKAAAFAIPMALVAVHLAAVPLTGSSVNPARSLGPAIIGSDFVDIWVYIVGPLVGAAIGYYLDKFINADA